MAKFVYIFSGGEMAETPEGQAEAMEAWGAWFGTLGESITDPGNPFGGRTAVGAAGGALTAGGYSIVSADSLEDAAAKAKGCPVLLGGGTVEVYEAVPM
jgi:hypothetical protein